MLCKSDKPYIIIIIEQPNIGVVKAYYLFIIQTSN